MLIRRDQKQADTCDRGAPAHQGASAFASVRERDRYSATDGAVGTVIMAQENPHGSQRAEYRET